MTWVKSNFVPGSFCICTSAQIAESLYFPTFFHASYGQSHFFGVTVTDFVLDHTVTVYRNHIKDIYGHQIKISNSMENLIDNGGGTVTIRLR
nr:MAG TPA: hypothetical protein [Caudoviricetes sp.]